MSCMSKEAELRTFANTMNKDFSFLEDWGYSPAKIELRLNDPKFGNDVKLIFSNKAQKRELSIRYDPFGVDGERVDLLFVFVENLGTEESFSLKDYWLQIHNNEKVVTCLQCFDGETFEQKISDFSQFLKQCIQKELSGVIKGSEWIDITFDWSPYK